MSPSVADGFGSQHALSLTRDHERYRVAWEVLHFIFVIAGVLVSGTGRWGVQP